MPAKTVVVLGGGVGGIITRTGFARDYPRNTASSWWNGTPSTLSPRPSFGS